MKEYKNNVWEFNTDRVDIIKCPWTLKRQYVMQANKDLKKTKRQYYKLEYKKRDKIQKIKNQMDERTFH